MESGYSLNKEMANRKVSVVELQGGKSAGQMFYFWNTRKMMIIHISNFALYD